MNKNEKAVLDLIKADPYISQKELGDKLNLTRSTIASIISSLNKKNIIRGRGYILSDLNSGVFCIGGMNVDRKYYFKDDLVFETSNPTRSEAFVGGVGRNVCENLGRLGFVPYILSVAANDFDFDLIKNQSGSYVNFDYVTTFANAKTGTYSALLDKNGDLILALADMDIYDHMTLEWIRSYEEVLKNAELIILDLNTPKDVVRWLIEFSRTNEIDLVVITVSSPKMERLPENLKGLSFLITNEDESAAYFSEEIKSEEDFLHLGDKWIATGLDNVIVTRSTKSCLYQNKDGEKMLFKPPLADKVLDVTGAGDSFSAGIIYGLLMDYDMKKTIELALTNAYETVQVPETVRKNLTDKVLEEGRKNLIEKGLLWWI